MCGCALSSCLREHGREMHCECDVCVAPNTSGWVAGFQLLMQIVLLHRSHRGSMSSLQDGLVAKQICVENCDTVPLLNYILFNSLKIGL